jgi:hypothetical protein
LLDRQQNSEPFRVQMWMSMMLSNYS